MKNSLWFVIAVIVALIATIMPDVALYEGFPFIALVIGLLLGFFFVTKKESITFMLAYLVLVAVVGLFSTIPAVGTFVHTLFVNLLGIFGGTALLVAVRALVGTTSKK